MKPNFLYRCWSQLRGASNGSTFLSLRWRLFPPLILLMLAMALTQWFLAVKQQTDSTVVKQKAVASAHQKNLEQLIQQYLVKLSSVGQYLDLLRQSQSTTESSEQGMLAVVKENWLDAQLSFGFDGLALYNSQQELLFNEGVEILPVSGAWVAMAAATSAPIHTIHCSQQCSLVVAIPQLLEYSQTEMVLLVAVDLAVVVRELASIHSVDMLLLKAEKDNSSSIQRLWGWPILASSVPYDAQDFFSFLQTSVTPKEALTGIGVAIGDRDLWLRMQGIESIDGELAAHLLIIDDMTEVMQLNQRYRRNSLLIMFGLIFIAIVLAWLSLGSPLNRIGLLAGRLPMLAEREYRAFRESSEKHRGRVMDEVDRLQMTSVQLAHQLEGMQDELELRANEMQTMALTDPLTKLANRALFTTELRREIAGIGRSDGNVGILFLDLDRFKNLNDTLGHYAGDQLLKEVARRLKAAVRQGDCVARIGGDEFTIMICNVKSLEALEVVIQKVFDCFAVPVDLGEARWTVQTSIGAILISDSSTDAGDALKRADLAMYDAKQAGRGTHRIYNEAMQEELNSVVNLEQELRQALLNGEFLLHYQPIFDSQTCRMTSVEALLRWQNPEKGLLPAGAFIHVLERTEMMREVGYQMLSKAVNLIKQLERCGRDDVTVSFNFASVQLLDEKLYDFLRDCLISNQVAPDRFVIEVTESLWMENLAAASEQIERLRALGIRVSLDDFGTGYSSLSYLRSLPMDIIKIDRSFIAKLEDDQTDQAIVKSIVELCRNLGKRVVVEGVETQQQLEILQQMSASAFQGYYLARPMPQDQLLELAVTQKHPRL